MYTLLEHFLLFHFALNATFSIGLGTPAGGSGRLGTGDLDDRFRVDCVRRRLGYRDSDVPVLVPSGKFKLALGRPPVGRRHRDACGSS